MAGQEASNTKVVQDAYAAFGRGDIQVVIDSLGDDIVWQGVKGAGKNVPMSGERRGKPAVGEFFKQVGANLTFSTFEPREFVAQDDQVVAIGHHAAMTSAKKTFASDFVMVFTLRGGKIVLFREFLDSAAINAAF
jgi:ketosteroid isomerase-like protein